MPGDEVVLRPHRVAEAPVPVVVLLGVREDEQLLFGGERRGGGREEGDERGTREEGCAGGGTGRASSCGDLAAVGGREEKGKGPAAVAAGPSGSPVGDGELEEDLDVGLQALLVEVALLEGVPAAVAVEEAEGAERDVDVVGRVLARRWWRRSRRRSRARTCRSCTRRRGRTRRGRRACSGTSR